MRLTDELTTGDKIAIQWAAIDTMVDIGAIRPPVKIGDYYYILKNPVDAIPGDRLDSEYIDRWFDEAMERFCGFRGGGEIFGFAYTYEIETCPRCGRNFFKNEGIDLHKKHICLECARHDPVSVIDTLEQHNDYTRKISKKGEYPAWLVNSVLLDPDTMYDYTDFQECTKEQFAAFSDAYERIIIYSPGLYRYFLFADIEV
jgi:hypothetical protein